MTLSHAAFHGLSTLHTTRTSPRTCQTNLIKTNTLRFVGRGLGGLGGGFLTTAKAEGRGVLGCLFDGEFEYWGLYFVEGLGG